MRLDVDLIPALAAIIPNFHHPTRPDIQTVIEGKGIDQYGHYLARLGHKYKGLDLLLSNKIKLHFLN